MRPLSGLIIPFALFAGIAQAQPPANEDKSTPTGDRTKPTDPRARCSSLSGIERSRCLSDIKAAENKPGASGMTAKDTKLVNETAAAAQAKMTAGDFGGAVALYEQVIGANPNITGRYHLIAGQAVALRRQAVGAYNAGPQPSVPPAGASNDVIRAANAANAAVQAQKVAAALPILKQALAAAVQAATLADAQKDRTADAAIGLELREDAGLLYRLDHEAVLATPRASIDTEVTWFNRWFDATNPLAEALAAKYGVATAAALTAKDKAAGLALADKVRARTGNEAEGILGYADIVAAARLPAGDPRRVKALADLTAVEATLADGQQVQKAKRLKTALAAAS